MLLKNRTIDGYAYQQRYSRRIYIALGPRYFGDYRNTFQPNIGKDQKKSYDLIAGPLALCHLMNP